MRSLHCVVSSLRRAWLGRDSSKEMRRIGGHLHAMSFCYPDSQVQQELDWQERGLDVIRHSHLNEH